MLGPWSLNTNLKVPAVDPTIGWKIEQVGETRFELILEKTGEAKAAGSKASCEAALRLFVRHG